VLIEQQIARFPPRRERDRQIHEITNKEIEKESWIKIKTVVGNLSDLASGQKLDGTRLHHVSRFSPKKQGFL